MWWPSLSILMRRAIEESPWPNIPLEMLNRRNTNRIGEELGNVIKVDDPQGCDGVGRSFLHVRVEMEVNKPLVGTSAEQESCMGIYEV